MSIELKQVHPLVLSIIKKMERLEPTWYDKPSVSMGKGETGKPDFLIFCESILCGVECKGDLYLQNGSTTTDKSKLPTPKQTRELRKIKKAGGLGIIVHLGNAQEFVKFVNGWVNDGMGVGELQLVADNHGLDVEHYATDYKELTI